MVIGYEIIAGIQGQCLLLAQPKRFAMVLNHIVPTARGNVLLISPRSNGQQQMHQLRDVLGIGGVAVEEVAALDELVHLLA